MPYASRVGLGDDCSTYYAVAGQSNPNPVTLANAELLCLYGAGNYSPVRQPYVDAFPGSQYSGGVATAVAPNPILAAPSTSINTGGVFVPNGAAPNPTSLFATSQPLNAQSGAPNPPIQTTLLQNLANSVPNSIYDLFGSSDSTSGTPTWLWIALAALGAVIVVDLIK